MKAYVAGRSSEVVAVRRAQALLRAVGYEITFDWTAWPLDLDNGPPEEARAWAVCERRAVKDADLFVLLWKHDKTFERVPIGKLIEFGMAAVSDSRIIVVGDPPESIFWHLPKVERVRDLDALARLLGFFPEPEWAA